MMRRALVAFFIAGIFILYTGPMSVYTKGSGGSANRVAEASLTAVQTNRFEDVYSKGRKGGDTPGSTSILRKVEPPVSSLATIGSADLGKISWPLRRINTRAKANISNRNLDWVENHGERVYFNPEIVLFRKVGEKEITAIRTLRGDERAAVAALMRREDVEFASLDRIQKRQFMPSDANLGFQWHHALIGSFDAWDHGLGRHTVTVAIVDAPFQMHHADLAENVTAGWDVTDEMPILTSPGDPHATGAAGLAAAVINNHLGIAGMANCRILPIGMSGATSEMYQAVLWAADHNIRVVNISWTGGNEEVLQAAGEYLEEHAEGMLVMPGVNGVGRLDFANHPNIICVSMTDGADNLRSYSGPHIDFAAPGWDVYSTTTNSMYGVVRGTSYAAPLFSGIVAMVMSINPALTAAQVFDVIQRTADDKGNAGWDESYGWGRVNFRAAVNETLKTLPRILEITSDSIATRIAVRSAWPSSLVLERSERVPFSWAQIAEVNSSSNLTVLADPFAGNTAFYRVRAEAVPE